MKLYKFSRAISIIYFRHYVQRETNHLFFAFDQIDFQRLNGGEFYQIILQQKKKKLVENTKEDNDKRNVQENITCVFILVKSGNEVEKCVCDVVVDTSHKVEIY